MKNHHRWLFSGIFALFILPGLAPAQANPSPASATETSFREASLQRLVKQIDSRLEAAWKKENITPATMAPDAEFLRRVYLDLAGRIPTVAESRRFLDDPAVDKRRKLIDELLARPGYLNFFSATFRNEWLPQTGNNVQFSFEGQQFELAIRNQLSEEKPIDQIVRKILTLPNVSPLNRIQPATSNVIDNGTLAFYRSNEFKPENVAATVTRVFFGVKMECSQCHDNFFAQHLTQEMFWETAAFFADILPQNANASDPKARRSIKIPKSTPETVTAKFFDGSEPDWDALGDKSPREALADWLTSAKNPYFAKNMANRMWAHFFGNGIIDPVDEPWGKNEATHPELLDDLATALVEEKFDLKFIIRAIALSKAYNLTSKQTHESQKDPRQLGRMNVKSMTAEQLFDSLVIATGYREQNNNNFTRRRFSQARNDFIARFNTTEKTTEAQTSILQALLLMNGRFTAQMTSTDMQQSEILAALLDAPFFNTNDRVETLFIATVGRRPDPEEKEKYASYVDRGGPSGDKNQALADVFWALLNSSEFRFNR